jgi:acyl carrier protein
MASPTRTELIRLYHEVLAETGSQANGELHDGAVLLESGLDSLGFAILVARIEDELGLDPFSASEEAFYPRTFGEFVQLYEQSAGQ